MTPTQRRSLGLVGLGLAPALLVTVLLVWLQARDDGAPAHASSEPDREPASTSALDLAAGRLLRPGPLVPAHAELEGAASCTSCHGTGANVPDARCLACHEEIALRADRDLPYHGTLEGSCADCHADHSGTDGSLIDLDARDFQHSRTRYPLQGAHLGLDCEACHQVVDADQAAPEFHYQGVPFARCSNCHRDPHGSGPESGRDLGVIRSVALDAAPSGPGPRDESHPLGNRNCADCHSEASFRASGLLADSFDHGADTHYALLGAHAELRCEACHDPALRERERAEEIAPGTAAGSDCGDCHDDPHRGELGGATKCAACHVPQGWGEHFDHDPHTDFALDALHGRLSCESCHEGASFSSKGKDCASCHVDAERLLSGGWEGFEGEPDVHLGHVACADCHGVSLEANRGAALAERCTSCHPPSYGPLLATWRARLSALASKSSLPPELAERLRRSGAHNFAQAQPWLAESAAARPAQDPGGGGP